MSEAETKHGLELAQRYRMASFKKRKVNESELYRSGRDALLRVHPRLNEVLEGIVGKIIVEPTRFPRVIGMETRRARTEAFPPDIPSYTILVQS